GEGRFEHEAGGFRMSCRELGRDRAAQRMSDEDSLVARSELGELVPSRFRVFGRALLARRDVGALAEAAVVEREHREAELPPALDAARARRQVPARAV